MKLAGASALRAVTGLSVEDSKMAEQKNLVREGLHSWPEPTLDQARGLSGIVILHCVVNSCLEMLSTHSLMGASEMIIESKSNRRTFHF